MASSDNAHDGVVILGAGLAGLGCARELPGAQVFEAKSHVGGHAWSHEVGGFHFDEGAHICHSRDQAYLDLVFGSAGKVNHIAKSNVVNRRVGKWITYPVQNHLHELDVSERTQALIGFVKAQTQRAGICPANYFDWCLNQYGEFLTESFYAAYTAKYWRTGMAELSTDWLSGRLLPVQVDRVIAGAMAKQHDDQAVFSAFHYPSSGGYFKFYEKLYQDLSIKLNARAVEVDLVARSVFFADGTSRAFSELVSSISLPVLVRLIKDAPVSVREAANRLRNTQLLCVNIVVNRAKITDLHWFYIYDHHIEASRVSVVSNLSAEGSVVGKTAIQAEIFRRHDETFNIEELVENTVEHLCRMLSISRHEIELVKTVVVPHAYIISDLERSKAVDHIHVWLRSKGVYCTGLLGKWKFIWSDVALRDGTEIGIEIKEKKI